MALDPDDARAVLKALVQHIEAEQYLERAVEQIREDMTQLRVKMDAVEATLNRHVEEAAPLIEATRTARTLQSGTRLMMRAASWAWRTGRWLLGVVALAWALVHYDRDLVLRALALLGGKP